MPNNSNPLPSSGRITLQDIADAFYLYKPYTDMSTVDITNYYGDYIKYYFPSARDGSTNIPPSSGKRIRLTDFYGKRYALPIPLFINSPVNNYNVFDNASAYATSVYGLSITNSEIPFFITVTNNSNVTSSSVNTAALNVGVSSDGTRRLNTVTSVLIINNGTIAGRNATGGARSDAYGSSTTWTVPAGVSSVYAIVVGGGGGGGGGQEVGNGNGGGGGGHGGLNTGTFNVSQGQQVGIGVGGGGSGGGGGGRGDQGSGSSGGGSGVAGINAGGGGGGGSPSGGSPGGQSGQTGGDDHASGGGGSGGGSPYGGYGAGGNGASFWDRTYPLSWRGNNGSGGVVILQYNIKLQGGPAISLIVPTSIQNNSTITGGSGDGGGSTGFAVIGSSFLQPPLPGGNIIGGYN